MCAVGLRMGTLPVCTGVPAVPAGPVVGTRAAFAPVIGPVLHLLQWELEGTQGAGPSIQGPGVPTSWWLRLHSPLLPTQPLIRRWGTRRQWGAPIMVSQLTCRGAKRPFSPHTGESASPGLWAAPRSITSSALFSLPPAPQPPPRHSLVFLSPPAFSWQIVR